jgi:hypothetical protein
VKTRKSKAEAQRKAWDAWWEARLAASKPHIAAMYKFDKECPAEFGGLKKLLETTLSKEISDDDLKIAIGGAVYSGRRLHREAPYKKLLIDVIRDSYAAEALIGKIYEQMQLIDEEYLEGCLDHVQLSLSGEDKKHFLAIRSSPDEGRVPMLMRFSRLAMQGLSRILSDITGNPERGKAHSRPAIPYVTETAHLMDAWRDLTGREAVAAKGSALGRGGEKVGVQPSTEFVRLCLKMIDPDTMLANARTCINNARKIKKEMW